jgi:hypothetical protein
VIKLHTATDIGALRDNNIIYIEKIILSKKKVERVNVSYIFLLGDVEYSKKKK